MVMDNCERWVDAGCGIIRSVAALPNDRAVAVGDYGRACTRQAAGGHWVSMVVDGGLDTHDWTITGVDIAGDKSIWLAANTPDGGVVYYVNAGSAIGLGKLQRLNGITAPSSNEAYSTARAALYHCSIALGSVSCEDVCVDNGPQWTCSDEQLESVAQAPSGFADLVFTASNALTDQPAAYYYRSGPSFTMIDKSHPWLDVWSGLSAHGSYQWWAVSRDSWIVHQFDQGAEYLELDGGEPCMAVTGYTAPDDSALVGCSHFVRACTVNFANPGIACATPKDLGSEVQVSGIAIIETLDGGSLAVAAGGPAPVIFVAPLGPR